MLKTSLDYHNFDELANAIDSFVNLAQIKTVFLSIDGVLVENRLTHTDPQDVQRALLNLRFQQYSVFPVAVNMSLWGVMLCDSKNISQQRIHLCRGYLESVVSQCFNATDDFVSVWEALQGEHLGEIRYFMNQFVTDSASNDKIIDFSSLATPTPKAPQEEPIVAEADPFDATSDIQKSMNTAVTYIGRNIRQPISLDDVAEKVFLSPSYLSRIFKKFFNVNFIDYVNNQKIALSQEQLVLTKTPISQISQRIGFSQTSYFTKIFKRKTGLTPSAYRKRNQGIKKIYTIPRTIHWRADDTIYDISKRFFDDHNITFYSQSVNGYPYINAIEDLADSAQQGGWVYTVDCRQPAAPASAIAADDKSVIQWIYTGVVY